MAVAFAVATPGSPLRSLGWAFAGSALIGALVATAARRPAAIVFGLAGAAFVPWLAVRTSPWLTWVNLLAASALTLTSLGLPAAGSLRVPVAHHIARLGRAIARLPLGPSHLAHDVRRVAVAGRSNSLRRLVPSLAVGAVALSTGLAILASGDALLASFFDVGDLLGTVVTRVIAGLCGATAFAVLIGAIHAPGSRDRTPTIRSAPVMPTLFGIGGLSIAIGVYAATQLSAAILGAEFVQGRTGLTYAEYARGGFFQMVVIAFVSVAAIGVARGVLRTTPDAARHMHVGAAALTVGVVITVVSAVVKLGVYADTFGLTMLRVYTVVFAGWLGVVALSAFAALLRPLATWFAPVLLCSMLIGAFAMNVVDPERIVVEHNLDRAASTGKLDVGYLDSMSLDAAPSIFSRLDTIDAVYERPTRAGVEIVDASTELQRRWCDKVLSSNDDPTRTTSSDGWSFNLARRAAQERASEHCT